MPYKLIKGEFHIFNPTQPRQGPEPDGDTIKFRPDNPTLIEQLQRAGVAPDFNGQHMINVRFEAIDALETHFDDMHQQLELALAARDSLLQQLGFGAVTFFADLPFKVQSVENHPRRGYILSNTLDGNGRVVAFVYAGDSPLVDGATVWVDGPMTEASTNAQLLRDGLVYPTFYSSLPIELKQPLAQLAISARGSQLGVWADATANVDHAASIPDLNTLQTLVIWPKLFRRLASYFATGYHGLGQFDSWLRADPIHRDDRVILPNRELGNMHDLITINEDRVQMLYQPEDLIIVPDDAVIVRPPPPPPPPTPERRVRIIAALVNPVGEERGHEVVTLLNLSPDAVDLTGWALADRNNGRQRLGGTLAPGGAAQLTLTAQVTLNNTGDTITLFDNTNAMIDQVAYSAKQAQREGWTLVF